MIEKTLKDTYDIRTKQLNGVSYDDYLKSIRWVEIKKKLWRKPKNRECRKCGNKDNLHFHHLTYKNINTNKDYNDIMVFCANCHKKIHNISKKRGLSVYRSTISYLNTKKDKKVKLKVIKEIIIIPKSNAEISHELNNEKLLKQLNKYKDYHKNNGNIKQGRKNKKNR